MDNKMRNIRAIILFIVAVLLIFIVGPCILNTDYGAIRNSREIKASSDIINKAFLILDFKEIPKMNFDSYIVSELKKLGFEEVKLSSPLANCFVSFQKKADSWIFIVWEEKESENGKIKKMKFKEAFVAIYPIRKFLAYYTKDGYSFIDVDANIWTQDKEKQREHFEAKILSTLKWLYPGFDLSLLSRQGN